MAYYRKNKRRFDPRYFMNERMEQIDEMIPGDPGLPKGRFSDDEDAADGRGQTPGDMARELWNARQNSGPEALEDYERSVEDQLANLAYAEDEELESQRIRNLEEGCGESQTYFVDIGMGRAEFDDLDALINTARIWNDTPGIDIVDASPEVLDALGIEVAASEPLPSLMDEEPPLEE